MSPIGKIAAAAALLGACAADPAAAFVYTPSPHAVRGTVAGVGVAIDIRTRSDQMGTYVQLAMLQQVDATHWDYVGNLPVRGRMPDARFGNAGQVWELTVSTLTSYRSPAMAEPMAAPAAEIFAAHAATMVSDWVPKMNATLAAIFAPGTVPTLAPEPPAAAPPAIADWEQGRDTVARLLGGYALKGAQLVPKSAARRPARR
jgi:hypothetical protein